MLYLETPAGVGFSYSDNGSYYSGVDDEMTGRSSSFLSTQLTNLHLPVFELQCWLVVFQNTITIFLFFWVIHKSKRQFGISSKMAE